MGVMSVKKFFFDKKGRFRRSHLKWYAILAVLAGKPV
jgi:uncharacterized membrane protein YhaH (DUF805 family)